MDALLKAIERYHRASDELNSFDGNTEGSMQETEFQAAVSDIMTGGYHASSADGAIAALHLARNEATDFCSGSMVEPLLNGTVSFFENAEVASGTAIRNAIDMAAGLDLSGVRNANEWSAIYDALTTVDEVLTSITNRPGCQGEKRHTLNAAGEYLDRIGEFIVWERTRVVDAMREAVKVPSKESQGINKLILRHDIEFSEDGFEDIISAVHDMSARYVSYKSQEVSR